MSDLNILWSPRVVLAGRTFRLPVAAPDETVEVEAEGCRLVNRRWAAHAFNGATWPSLAATGCWTGAHNCRSYMKEKSGAEPLDR